MGKSGLPSFARFIRALRLYSINDESKENELFFLDEIQNEKEYDKTVNSLYIRKNISDVLMLESLVRFLFDNRMALKGLSNSLTKLIISSINEPVQRRFYAKMEETMSEKVIYEGKSKIICEGPDSNSFIMRYKDTATAFNGEKKEDLSGKGKLNSAISNLIFDYLAKNGIETHLIKIIDDISAVVKKCEIVMVEVIVRNIAAGSFSKKFGVPEGTALKNITTEFSLKSDELGDPMINDSQITAIDIATQHELDFMRQQALKINELLCALFIKMGIKLVDFKLEFGRVVSGEGSGKIILCDEISPDSCRFWDAQTNKKLDKDVFRRDLGDVLEGYREVLKRLNIAEAKSV